VDVALEEQAKVAEAFLRGLASEMGVSADISVKQDGEESIELSLEGPDLGLLIGPKGATLLALQDLTRTVVQRKTGASNGRLWVDVSGYRQKRAAALARFAQQVANEVLTTGNRKAMEPMSAADRKVVHDTINDIEGVATLSEGEDTNRRVVVYAVTD
jgi:spoIIIJ-associated protein